MGAPALKFSNSLDLQGGGETMGIGLFPCIQLAGNPIAEAIKHKSG